MTTSRILLLAFIIAVVATSSHATDFVAKKLTAIAITPGSYQISLLVRNDNVLGDVFTVKYEVFTGPNGTGTRVFNEMKNESVLAPYTERTVTCPMTFSPPSSGTYYGRALVVYAQEIDPSDNLIDLIFEALRPACDARERWHPGPAMVIESNIKIWPDTPMIANKLRPGDVIGIAALVSDLDLMEEICGCLEESKAELRGPYPDQVNYEWTLSGPGTIIKGASGSQNSVMYQIPLCPPDFFFDVTVSLRVVNNAGQAADGILSGSVTFRFNTSRLYPANFTPTWDSYTFDVVPNISPLRPLPDVPVETIQGRSCTPLPPSWVKGSGIVAPRGIVASSAPFLCPEYLTLASVAATDVDNYEFVCEQTATSCSPNDSLKNTNADRLVYTWSIIGGAGDLPVPSNGPSILVRRSASKPTILQCVIDDGAAQANDDPLTVIDTLPPVGKPKAYVGLGDDEGTSVSKLGHAVYDYWATDGANEDPYGGRSGALRGAYESMVTKLTDAGYDVVSNDSMLVTVFNGVFSNPCIKVFVFVGHGYGGHINMARMNIGGWNTPERGSSHVKDIAKNTFGCDRNPFLRDIALLACETMKGGWNDTQVWGRSHGWATTKTFFVLRNWAYWVYKPLPPIILTVD